MPSKSIANKNHILRFGERLRYLRKLSNITQAQLAERAGISFEHVNKLERGVAGPSFGVICSLAEALATEPANLFLSAAPPQSISLFQARRATKHDIQASNQDNKDAPPPDGDGFVDLSASVSMPVSRYYREGGQDQPLGNHITHMGNWRLNLRTREAHWPLSMYTLLKRDRAKGQPGIDQAIAEHIHPDDFYLIRSKLERLFKGEPVHKLEFRLLRADGAMIHAMAEVEVECDDDGEPDCAYGAILDVTELKRLLDFLRVYNSRLEEELACRNEAYNALLVAMERSDRLENESRDPYFDSTGAESGDATSPRGPRAIRSGQHATQQSETKLVATPCEAGQLENVQPCAAPDANHPTEREMLDVLPQFVAYLDANLVFRRVNMTYKRAFGLSPEIICGKSLAEVIGVLAYQQSKPYFDQALAGVSVRYHEQFLAPDATVCHVDGRIIPRKNPAGEVLGLYTVFTDITIYKNTEQELREKEQRLRRVTDDLPLLVAELNPALEYVFVNSRYEEFFERPASKIIGRHVSEVLGGSAFSTIKQHLHKALAGQSTRFQAWIHPPNGQRRRMDVRYIPRVGEDGAVEGIHLWARDITEEKQARAGAARLSIASKR